MEKKVFLYGAALCAVVAATLGTLGIGLGAFSFGATSIVFLLISTQFKG